MAKKHSKAKRNSSPQLIGDFCPDFIKKYAKSPHLDVFRELWDNWDLVCPGEVLSLAKPCGIKGKSLLIGADTPLDLQEVRMYYSEILERANVFLKSYGLEDYFEKIEMTLLQGKKSLLEREKMPEHFVNVLPPRPQKYGGKIDFRGNKSLQRCYEAFCRRLDLEKGLK